MDTTGGFWKPPGVLLSITSVAVLSFLCEFKISRPVIEFGVLIILIQQSVSLLVNPSKEDFSVFKDFRVYLRLAISTEYNFKKAWGHDTGAANPDNEPIKDEEWAVRAIRAF